jgi:lysine biosynthesis protein LysW
VIQNQACDKEIKTMAVESISKTASAVCPDCGAGVVLRGALWIGQEVICPHCDIELEVVETDPLELDWPYDDEWEEEEEED